MIYDSSKFHQYLCILLPASLSNRKDIGSASDLIHLLLQQQKTTSQETLLRYLNTSTTSLKLQAHVTSGYGLIKLHLSRVYNIRLLSLSSKSGYYSSKYIYLISFNSDYTTDVPTHVTIMSNKFTSNFQIIEQESNRKEKKSCHKVKPKETG